MFDRKRTSARRALDARLGPLRDAKIRFVGSQRWIRKVRYAIGMTGTVLAKRMGVTRQRVSDLEKAEMEGSATLTSMKKAAEALDCQFVYAFIPHVPLEEMVEVKAREIAIRELKRVDQTMALEDQKVSEVEFERRVTEYIQDHLRESDLWSEG